MKRFRIAMIALCLCVPAVDGASAGTVTLYDGTFNPSDWSLMTAGTDSGNTVTLSQQVSGGNPGDYQQMQFSLSSDSSTGVVGLAFYAAELYSPGASGAIASIDFSEDHFQTADLVGALALLQNGIVYVWQPTAYFEGTRAGPHSRCRAWVRATS